MSIQGKVHACALAVLSLVSLDAHSQTAPSQATHDEIPRWLRSGEPRMVAWGATFAAKSGDREELSTLASLAGNYQSVPPQEYDARGNYIPRTPEQEQRLVSMETILDPIIQLHGIVPYEAVTAILPDFTAQALTLFAGMPEPERSQRVAVLYATRDQSEQPHDWHRLIQQQMIHMAAAILALQPPPASLPLS